MERPNAVAAGLCALLAAFTTTGTVGAGDDGSGAVAALVARETGVSASRAAVVVRAVRVALVERDAARRLAVAGVRDDASAVGLLVGIAVRESGLRGDVERCEVGGDNGQAWGLWQAHDGYRPGVKARVCDGGLPVQAAQAVGDVLSCAARGRRGVGELLACYGGSKAEVERRVTLVERLTAAAAAR